MAKKTPKSKAKATKSGKSVGRNEIVKSIAAQTGVTQVAALAVVVAFLGTVKATVKKGVEVRLAGFGTFKKRHIKARTLKVFRKGKGLQQFSKSFPATTKGAFKVSSEFLA